MNAHPGNDDHDRLLSCLDCGAEFLFGLSEQAHFARLGFRDPIRCGGCRGRRKAQRQAGTGEYEGRKVNDGRRGWVEGA